MDQFTTKDIGHAVQLIAGHVKGIADDLNAADARLGDGDLGITVSNGWREVSNAAHHFPDDVGLTFVECAKCFQRVSSSSFGTLMATTFISAAKHWKGQTAVSFTSVSALLDEACSAMISTGKGQLGEKSVLDIVHSMAIAAKNQENADDLLVAIGRAVHDTLAKFKGRPNKLGRARMFGEKSIGLDDPGMLAVQEMVRALSK